MALFALAPTSFLRIALLFLICGALLSLIYSDTTGTTRHSCSKVWNFFDSANNLASEGKYDETKNQFLNAIYIVEHEMSVEERHDCEYVYQLYHNYALYHSAVGDVNQTTFYFDKALSVKRQGITLTQYAIFLSTQDQIFRAYDFLIEASQSHLIGIKDAEIRAATILPVVSSSRVSVNKVLDFLGTRLSLLEKKWYAKPPSDQIDPQMLVPWAPTMYRLHYLSKNMSLNLDFLKRKAKLNYWMTKSLKFVAKHLQAGAMFMPASIEGGVSAEHQKIKLGFFTTHFCKSHSLYMHAGKILESLPRDKFQIYYIRSNLVVCSPNDNVERADATHDIDVVIEGALQNLNAARQKIASLKLDILVNLEIGMEPLPYFLGFARLARVQMSTWCFVATSGIEDSIDYFISAKFLEPEIRGSVTQVDTGYTEQSVQFHHSPWILRRDHKKLEEYACNRGKGRDSSKSVVAAAQNLDEKLRQLEIPPNASIITCAQIVNKFHPDFDHLLLSILKQNPQSLYIVLVIALQKGDNEYNAVTFLKDRINKYLGHTLASRIKYLSRIDRLEYLELTSRSKVILDTLPWSAFTTAHEAMKLGVPLVTLPGPDIRGRFPFRLYKQMGYMDLVAKDVEEYVEIVTRLCTDPVYHSWVKINLLQKSKVLSSDVSMGQTVDEWVNFLTRAHRLAAR